VLRLLDEVRATVTIGSSLKAIHRLCQSDAKPLVHDLGCAAVYLVAALGVDDAINTLTWAIGRYKAVKGINDLRSNRWTF